MGTNGVAFVNGKRTAPSLNNRTSILHVIMKDGTYLYDAPKTCFEPSSVAVGSQDFVKDAGLPGSGFRSPSSTDQFKLITYGRRHCIWEPCAGIGLPGHHSQKARIVKKYNPTAR